jgi:hypothetical protein
MAAGMVVLVVAALVYMRRQVDLAVVAETRIHRIILKVLEHLGKEIQVVLLTHLGLLVVVVRVVLVHCPEEVLEYNHQ